MAKKGGGGLLVVLVVLGAIGYWYYREGDSSTAPPEPAGSSTGGGTGRYVALGDSYTSAPNTGGQVGSPAGCDRSDNNYPRLVAADLRPAEFVDVSCSGATTAHLGAAQQTRAGTNPPQLDAVNGATTLVTIGIGGNDVGFIALARECVSARPNASPCRDRLTSGGTDQLADRVAATADNVATALKTVRAKAPKARILVVGYPTVLPDGDGCWPSVPVGSPDIGYLRDSLDKLNTALAKQARANDAGFADTASPSKGHDICANSDQRWVEGFVPTSRAASLHPNARGERAMADAVLEALK